MAVRFQAGLNIRHHIWYRESGRKKGINPLRSKTFPGYG
jgi:hypothetical protein